MRPWFLSSLVPLLALVLLVGGCASRHPSTGGLDATSVTVVGVARHEDVEGINRSVAARDLVRRLQLGERRRVVGPERAREALGAPSYRALLARYATRGWLDEGDARQLAVAPLDTRYALLVRIERDDVLELSEGVTPRRDVDGRSLGDRLVVERATRRDLTLSTFLVDRLDGRLRGGERTLYAASPVTRVESTRYRGSSFSGSVAALLANRLVNGGSDLDAPPPPSRRATLEALFDEIEASLP